MKKFYFLVFLSLILCAQGAFSQARIVFQNDPYIVINDNAYLVIGNGNANAITNPAQGNIVSEDEFNYVKWNIANQTGSYVIPFTTANDDKIPVTVDISSAGSGGTAQHFLFSTYGGLGGANWDSFVNRPTPVNHTVDIATGLVNNSPYVIDRYYILDGMGYTNRPSATLSIGYADEEHTAIGNTIVESLLGGQRYNSDEDVWGDYLPEGTANTSTNVVTGIPAPAADFFRAWTLVSREMPLPVELLSFNAVCENGVMRVQWSTATELNNDFFMLERSRDALNWEWVKDVEGAGNSSVRLDYEVSDHSVYEGDTYYRLTQFDYNGTHKVYGPVSGNCSDFELDIVTVLNNFNSQELTLRVSSSINEDFDLYVLSMNGQVMMGQQRVPVRSGMNDIVINRNRLAMGVYIIQLVNDNHLLTRKVALN
ncbi:MAG: T9SS C-terminal target domain-containing protein [Cryomorphaceae bacterium]|nr:MAG: T9SS C-terminal target domain-containing protein [Cryomorphaceae bacterium]